MGPPFFFTVARGLIPLTIRRIVATWYFDRHNAGSRVVFAGAV